MRKIGVIVPVSPFEPPELIKKSVKWIKSLHYDPFEVKIVYVVDLKQNLKKDLKNEIDNRGKIPLCMGVDVVERKFNRGKRAGAINDAIEYLKNFNPDYIAIFDVDSRPEKDFIIRCVDELEKNPKAYIASSGRYISNPVNPCSETVEAEYYLINFLLKRYGFKQFNGLIGVLRADLIMNHGLNENAITEDADFATRMHTLGYEAIFVEGTRVFEQAPLKWSDLYAQRKRWYFGGLQLWNYYPDVFKAERKFKFSWIASLTIPYFISIVTPFLILAPPLILYKFRKLGKVKVTAGLLIHILILQFAALSSLWNFIRGRGVEWRPQKRVTN
jgi:cellulose synthase/poly-beta-1,6-N-acetylglucosamine synthase-like glycosyltransferase